MTIANGRAFVFALAASTALSLSSVAHAGTTIQSPNVNCTATAVPTPKANYAALNLSTSETWYDWEQISCTYTPTSGSPQSVSFSNSSYWGTTASTLSAALQNGDGTATLTTIENNFIKPAMGIPAANALTQTFTSTGVTITGTSTTPPTASAPKSTPTPTPTPSPTPTPVPTPTPTLGGSGGQACPANMTLTNGQCVCNAPQVTDNHGGCQCPISGQVFANGACGCPGGTTSTNGQCIPNCPNGMSWNGSSCVCPISGQQFNDATHSCSCPGNQVVINGACGCPAGTVLSANGNQNCQSTSYSLTLHLGVACNLGPLNGIPGAINAACTITTSQSIVPPMSVTLLAPVTLDSGVKYFNQVKNQICKSLQPDIDSVFRQNAQALYNTYSAAGMTVTRITVGADTGDNQVTMHLYGGNVGFVTPWTEDDYLGCQFNGTVVNF